jgi:hypothetical protein
MSVPAAKEPAPDGRWETIRYALDSNPRTFRLCLIIIVLAASSALTVMIALRFGSAIAHAVSQMKTWL